MPLAKAPPGPSRWLNSLALPRPAKPGMGISQTPKKAQGHDENDGRESDRESAILKEHAPADAITTARVASTMNTLIKPSEYQKLSMNARERLWPDCSMKLNNFRPMTGSTQGIMLRINPPANAKAKMARIDLFARSSLAAIFNSRSEDVCSRGRFCSLG